MRGVESDFEGPIPHFTLNHYNHSYRREGMPMTHHRLIGIRTASTVLKTACLKGRGFNPIYRQ